MNPDNRNRADRFPSSLSGDISSPMAYPSSPASTSTVRARLPSSSLRDNMSSPLNYPSSRSEGPISSQPTPRQRSDIPHTPRRSDLGIDYRSAPRVNTTASAHSATDTGDEEYVQVIWGTNINIHDVQNDFKDFMLFFTMNDANRYEQHELTPQGNDKLYRKMLFNMMEMGLTNINIDFRNLLAFPRTTRLAHQLINYPHEIIPILDNTVKEVMMQIAAEEGTGESDNRLSEVDSKEYKTRPYNLPDERGLRDLNPDDIDKLITVKGLVLRTTPIIPDMNTAFFKCAACGNTVQVIIDRGVIEEPTVCPRRDCAAPNSMELVHDRSFFTDKQIVRIQEIPSHVPDGQTPYSLSVVVYDELVDVCRAGDRVTMTGVFRSVPIRVNPQQRTVKSLFKTYIDILHIQKTDNKRLGVDVSTLGNTNLEAMYARELNQESANRDINQENEEANEIRHISQEQKQKIHDTASRPDVYDLLARSIAPSIFEQDDVKKGLLLQLFGGANKKFTKGGSPRYRGDINVLLCGDPSTSKSQILQYIHKIAPRGMYTSGKGSSAVGLTAYVTRDQETKQLVLESGALVLSDGGICCIDEFDKMNDSTRSVLHEVMEQQTVSVAKAGIITTLNARTSILASANPIGSKYNPDLSVIQNIDLPPTLLSRFDLVYLMLDKVDERSDRQLAHHLARMYLEDAPENAAPFEILPIEFLTLYITYAKEHVHPVITEPARTELVTSYVAMRKLGEDVRAAEKRITATTRQLESMIRLAEAHAKMRLSQEVTVADVKEAVRLIRSAIKDYATDPRTGRIDMGMVQTGTSLAQRVLRSSLKEELVKLIDQMTSSGNTVRYSDVVRRISEEYPDSVSRAEIAETLRNISTDGLIAITGDGARKTIRKFTGQV